MSEPLNGERIFGNGQPPRMDRDRGVTTGSVIQARYKAIQQIRRIRGIREQALRERGSGSLVSRLDGLLVSNRELAQYLGASEAELERLMP